MRYLRPRTEDVPFSNVYHEGSVRVEKYKPWLNERDAENVFFASVHGYGARENPTRDTNGLNTDDRRSNQDDTTNHGPWFYPGSGSTTSTSTRYERI